MSFDEYQEEQTLNQECDALLAHLEARRQVEKAASDSELVYKVREDSLQPKQEAQMDEQRQREWNEWATLIARVEATKISNELVEELDEYHDAIQKRIAALEARVAALEDANVVPFGGGRLASAKQS
jgi:hypothetical protein